MRKRQVDIFFNRERKKSENRIIDKLVVSNPLTVTKYEDIIFHEFYEQLFKKEAFDQSLVNYFLNDLVSLSEDQRNLCEGILTKDECFYALSHMKSFKSPGIDGLPKEF